MKQIHRASKIILVLLATFFFQSFSHPYGGDHYKVFLNNKLVTEQFLTQPVSMKTLSLTAGNNNDNLKVYYSHCGTAGKTRTVSVRNGFGVILKEWKFSDTKTIEVQLPVKDILNAAAKKGNVFLYYASKEIPSGKQLLAIDLSNKDVAKK